MNTVGRTFLFGMGVFASFGMLIVGFIAAGRLVSFIDIPSLFIVFAGGIATTLICFSPRDIGHAVKWTFQESPADGKSRYAAYFWKAIIRNLLFVGVLYTLTGHVRMLQNLSDPDSIAPSLAVASLTTLYALLVTLVLPLPCLLAAQGSVRKDAEVPDGESHEFGFMSNETWGGGSEWLTVAIATRLIGYGLFIGLFFVTTALSGRWSDLFGRIGAYIDIPSLLWVVGVFLGVALSAIGWGIRSLQNALAYSRILAWGLLLLAVMTTLIGTMRILTNFNPASVGPGGATIILGAMYALLCAGLVVHPLQDTLTSLDRPRSSGTFCVAGIALSAYAWLVLYAHVALLCFMLSRNS